MTGSHGHSQNAEGAGPSLAHLQGAVNNLINSATGPLLNHAKVSLYTEELGGYLAAASLQSYDLYVEPCREGQKPRNFERCVFKIGLTEDRQRGDGELSYREVQQGNQIITYGDSICLYHCYTATYLCMRKRSQSKVEKNAFRVLLIPPAQIGDEKDIGLTVLPRYKVRHEGEKVRVKDQVVFLSDTTESRYLHASSTPDEDGKLECNCSYNSSSWTIEFYDYDPVYKPTGPIRLGEPVFLFHKELEGFLASLARDDVGLRHKSKTEDDTSVVPISRGKNYIAETTANKSNRIGDLASFAEDAAPGRMNSHFSFVMSQTSSFIRGISGGARATSTTFGDEGSSLEDSEDESEYEGDDLEAMHEANPYDINYSTSSVGNLTNEATDILMQSIDQKQIESTMQRKNTSKPKKPQMDSDFSDDEDEPRPRFALGISPRRDRPKSRSNTGIKKDSLPPKANSEIVEKRRTSFEFPIRELEKKRPQSMSKAPVRSAMKKSNVHPTDLGEESLGDRKPSTCIINNTQSPRCREEQGKRAVLFGEIETQPTEYYRDYSQTSSIMQSGTPDRQTSSGEHHTLADLLFSDQEGSPQARPHKLGSPGLDDSDLAHFFDSDRGMSGEITESPEFSLPDRAATDSSQLFNSMPKPPPLKPASASQSVEIDSPSMPPFQISTAIQGLKSQELSADEIGSMRILSEDPYKSSSGTQLIVQAPTPVNKTGPSGFGKEETGQFKEEDGKQVTLDVARSETDESIQIDEDFGKMVFESTDDMRKGSQKRKKPKKRSFMGWGSTNSVSRKSTMFSFSGVTGEVMRMKLKDFVSEVDRDRTLRRAPALFVLNHGQPKGMSQSLEKIRTSSNSLWLIEHEVPDRGGLVSWRTPYRLKHIASNRYLVIKREKKVNSSHAGRHVTIRMSSKAQGSASLFLLHPLDEEHGEHIVPSKTFLRVEHQETGLYFHMPWSHSAHGSDPGRTARSGKGKAHNRITPLTFSIRPHYEDVFVISRPSEVYLRDLNFVQANMQPLNAYCDALYERQYAINDEAFTKIISNAHASLTALIYFCTVSEDPNPFTRGGSPIVPNQELLLDQNVHHVLLDMLKAPFRSPIDIRLANQEPFIDIEKFQTPKYQSIQAICTLCYRLLRQTVMGSPTFALRLYKHIPFMQTQLQHRISVADTLMEIFKNNQTLLERLTEDILTCFVKLCAVKEKQANYLNFLCELCECNNRFIPKNQDIICEGLQGAQDTIILPMKMHEGHFSIMVPDKYVFNEEYTMKSPRPLVIRNKKMATGHQGQKEAGKTGFKRLAMQVSSNIRTKNLVNAFKGQIKAEGLPRGKWLALKEFCSQADSCILSYFEVSLNLFAQLCSGGNGRTQATVQKLISKEMILDVLLKPSGEQETSAAMYSVNENIKARLYKIATKVYIDDSSFAWSPSWFKRTSCKTWASLQDGGDITSRKWHSNKTRDPFILSLKLSSVDYLQQNTLQCIQLENKNRLIHSIVDMWGTIITQFCYTETELTNLVPHILMLVDGRTDIFHIPQAVDDPHYGQADSLAAIQGIEQVMMQSGGPYISAAGKVNLLSKQDEQALRHKMSEKNMVVMECKKAACDVIKCLIDRFALDLFHQCMHLFRRGLMESIGGNINKFNPAEHSIGRFVPGLLDSIGDLLAAAEFMSPPPEVVNDMPEISVDISRGASAHSAYSADNTEKSPEKKKDSTKPQSVPDFVNGFAIRGLINVQQLLPVVLDLSLYEHPELVSSALDLFIRVCSVRFDVNNLLQEATILFDGRSQNTYEEVCEKALKLKRLAQGHVQEEEEEEIITYLHFFRSLCGCTITDDEIEEDDELLELKRGQSVRNPRLFWSRTGNKGLMKNRSNIGHLSAQGVSFENQSILRTVELHSHVLDVLKRDLHKATVEGSPHVPGRASSHFGDNESAQDMNFFNAGWEGTETYNCQESRILKHSLYTLRAFCLNNPRNQQALWDIEPIPALLKLMFYRVGAHHTLRAMFANNYDLCCHVPAEVIETVMSMVANGLESPHLMIDFLKDLVVVNGMPIPRNQTLVMNALVENQTVFVHGDNGLNGQTDPEVIELITSMVDLVALCCVGMNSSTEDPAQGLLPLPFVLQILGEQEAPLPLHHQLPFVTFLREVWFLHESDGEPMSYDDFNTECYWWLNSEGWWLVVDNFHKYLVELVTDRTSISKLGDLQDYIAFVFDGILLCLLNFFGSVWSKPLSQRFPGSQIVISEEIVTTLCRFIPRFNDLASINHARTDVAVKFLKTMLASEIYGITRNRQWLINQITILEDVLENKLSEENDAVPTDSFYSFMQKSFEQVQQGCMERFHTDSVDDLPKVTELFVDICIKEHNWHFISNFISHMRAGFLSKRVMIGLLHLLTSLIMYCHDREDDRENYPWLLNMCQMQKKLDSLGATALLAELIQGNDDEIASQAIRFGIALLWGGNPSVQESLLRICQTSQLGFAASLNYRINKLVSFLKQRKREIAFLQEYIGWAADVAEYSEQLNNSELHAMKDLLRFLQLLCEGHFKPLQNYLRQQKGNLQSWNIISDVVTLLHEVVTITLTPSLLEIALQAFNTLTEFCQGPCQMNQKTLVGSNVCAWCNLVIAGQFPQCDPNDVFGLQGSAVLTLLSLLEGCDDKRIMHLMVKTITFPAMRKVLDDVWASLDETHLNEQQEEMVDHAFNLFILMYVLKQGSDDEILAQSIYDCKAFEYFVDMLGVIEIARDDVVEKVYFRKPTISRMLTEAAKQHLLQTVDRSSPAAKVTDFFDKARELIYEMEYHNDISNWIQMSVPVPIPQGCYYYSPLVASVLRQYREYFIEKICEGTQFWESGTLAMATLINLILSVYYPFEDRLSWPMRILIWTFLYIYGSLTLICSFNICLSLSIFQIPVIAHQQRLVIKNKSWPDIAWRFFRGLNTGTKAQYLFFLSIFMCSFLGLLYSPLFFCAHLLVVITKSTVLQNVIRSVTTNGWSLFATAFFGIIMVYLFTIVGYILFPEDYVTGEGQPLCHSLGQCFLYSVTNGIRAGGGIGDLLNIVTWGGTTHGFRLAYDTMFYVVVIVILINNGVFGIIIDTFAELRIAKTKVEEDTRNFCFICGIDAYTFDRYAEMGFVGHTRNSHNMWQYLYFLHHLKRKPTDEYTGQESYVASAISRKDMTFFPLNKSLELITAANQQVLQSDDSDSEEDEAPSLSTSLQMRDLVNPRYLHGRMDKGEKAAMEQTRNRINQIQGEVQYLSTEMKSLGGLMEKMQSNIVSELGNKLELSVTSTSGTPSTLEYINQERILNLESQLRYVIELLEKKNKEPPGHESNGRTLTVLY